MASPPSSTVDCANGLSIPSTPRLAILLPRVGLKLPPRITSLADGAPEEADSDVKGPLPSDIEGARLLLAQERKNSPDYRAPEKQKRDRWLRVTTRQKEEVRNHAFWQFTKNEVARTFSHLLSSTPLPPAAVAHTLLLHAPGDTLEELWKHLHDPELEKTIDRWYQKRNVSDVPQCTWLGQVTQRLDMDYIRLLCRAGPGQDSLDHAFGLALSQDSKDAMEILLSFGATASANQKTIRERFSIGDVALAELLLSASPQAMSISAWRHCLKAQVEDRQQTPTILLMCLSHRPEVACEHLLIQALKSQHLSATGVLLAYYAAPKDDRENLSQRTCELTRLVDNDDQRYAFFELLKEAELLTDCQDLRLELYKDTVNRHIPLIRLLVDAGVTLDADQHTNATRHIISRMDFELLELIAGGVFSKPACVALAYAPDTATESDMLRLVEILAPRGIKGLELDQELLRAARNEHNQLAAALLSSGASLEYQSGAAFLEAARNCNLSLLRILGRGRPPNAAISKAVAIAFKATDDQGYDAALATIDQLLKWGAHGEPLHVTLLAAASDDQRLEMVRLMVENGAQPSYRDGACFRVAFRTQNIKLLALLCDASPPSRETTETVLSTAIEPQHYRLESMELLLASTTSSRSSALNTFFNMDKLLGNPNLGTIIPCFLRHGLDVNLGKGAIVCFAVREMDSNLLRYVLSAGPNIASLTLAFQAALRLDSRPSSLTCMKMLLEAARSAQIGQSSALLDQTRAAINGDPAGLEILLRHGADVDHDNGAAIQAAAVAGSHAALHILLNSIPLASTLRGVCLATAKSPALTEDQQRETLRILLERADGVLAANNGFSQLLAESVMAMPQNSQLPTLLIERGVRIDFDVLQAAFPIVSRELFRVLTGTQSNTVVPKIFRTARETPMDSSRRYWIYETLLDRDVVRCDDTSEALSNIVGSCLAGSPPSPISTGDSRSVVDISIMRLLLAKGADPNQKRARCFMMAAKAGAETIFRLLSPHASLKQVFRALLVNFREEWQVLHWFNMCVEELPSGTAVDDDTLLFHAMQRFPNGAELVNALVENGVSVSTRISCRFCPEWKEEKCTPLIWALFSSPRVENDTVLALLGRGELSALPEYSTELSGVSAALCCILDATRAPILEALFALVGDRLLEYMIPQATFSRLAADSKAEANQEGLPLEIDLRQASMLLGNLDAYRVLVPEQVPNDGTLHTAALLALPRFVKWLLEFHDPDDKHSEFDQMIPLAIACRSKPCSWAKVANKEADWAGRRDETIRLLATRSSRWWRFNQKTILHIALEQGLAVTMALAEALDISNDSEKNDRYLYVDKSGLEYSPDEWISRVMEVGEKREKELLVRYLKRLGMQSRYFRRVLPGQGQQPVGYQGLPPTYSAAWNWDRLDGQQSGNGSRIWSVRSLELSRTPPLREG